MVDLSWNVTIQLLLLCHSSKMSVTCLIVIVWKFPASYWVVPLTKTDKHFLITVKISLNRADEEEMTCSELQMQHNLKNKPRCGWSCDNSVSAGDAGKQEQHVSRSPPQGCFWGDVELRRQVVAWNNVYLNNADVVELQDVGTPWVQMDHPFS